MSNIYLKVNIEKNLTFSKLWIYKLTKFVSGSVFAELQFTQVLLNFKPSCCNLKIRGLEAKMCMAFYFILILKGIMKF